MAAVCGPLRVSGNRRRGFGEIQDLPQRACGAEPFLGPFAHGRGNLALSLPGREIVIETWPEKPIKFLFPRHFLVLDASGGTLLEANSIWSVVDRAERKAVVPALAGLTVPKIERASLPLSAIGKIVRDLPPDRRRSARSATPASI
jgi:hypothetical protein